MVVEAEDADDADCKCFDYVADMFDLNQVEEGEFRITKVEEASLYIEQGK